MSQLSRRQAVALLTSFPLLLAAGCGNSEDSSDESLPHGVIKMTGFPTSTYLPFWVIREKHFDTRHGFALKYVNTTGGGSLYPPVVTGRADVTTILPPLAIQYATQKIITAKSGPLVPVPAFWVKATPDHPGTAIVARSGIDKISDLRGKTLATHDVVSGFFMQARTLLAQNGLHVGTGAADIRSSRMPFSAMGAALKNHTVDAALMDYVTALGIVSQGYGHILTNVLGAPPYDNYNMASFAFHRNFLKTRPKAVVALLMATLDANNWIVNHEQEAKNVLLKNLGITAASAADWVDGYRLDGFQTQFYVPIARSTVPQDETALRRWDMIDHSVDVDAIYEYGSLVQQAQQAWHADS